MLPNNNKKTLPPLIYKVEAAALRLDAYLSLKSHRSRVFIQEQIKGGHVTINGQKVIKSSSPLRKGDQIVLEINETPLASPIKAIPGELNIIYEDKGIMALNKPAGLVVHPGAGNREYTLVSHLLHYLKTDEFAGLSDERPGIVHRLDVGTTGLLLIAKDRKNLELLSNLFKERKIKKIYRALVWGKMPLSGMYESSLGRDTKNRQKISSRTTKGRTAITRWKTLERFGHFSYVQLSPETGRTHQLRVHLSEDGHAVVGDPTYGNQNRGKSLLAEPVQLALHSLNHTLLHAYELNFSHPSTQAIMQFNAPLPEDFNSMLTLLRKYDPCA